MITQLLQPTYLVQTIVLALSIFNIITFLWLTFTVWLNGNRASMIARVGIIGLGLSALFFYLHALLISNPTPQMSEVFTQDVLWHLIWLPALGVPYIWFIIGLHYASLINAGWRRRRPVLLLISGLLGLSVLVLLIANHSTFTFFGTLRLLAYGDVSANSTNDIFSPPVLLPVLFLIYVTFCAIGPWFTPARIVRLSGVLFHSLAGDGKQRTEMPHLPLRRLLADAFWDDNAPVEQLDEPVLSWHLARPGLLFAALLMVGLTTCLGVLGVWSMIHWLEQGGKSIHATAIPSFSTMPLSLLLLDLLATGAVSCIILLIGYSIVRHGILIERPLARRGFFEQWRGVVIVATAIALLIALMVAVTQSDLGGLLLITSLATCAYALFTWSSYTAHDRYVALLGPFLRGANMRHWLHTDVQKTEQSMEDLFFHLCHDVLEVQCARLVVFAGSVQRNFSYRWPSFENEERETDVQSFQLQETQSVPQEHLASSDRVHNAEIRERQIPKRVQMTFQGQPILCWVLPIRDELGVVALLYLGPRHDGSVFTEEDMDIAHACGQRILDTLRDHEAMQAVAGLLRRRIVDVKLLGAQHRRILHDEVLPQMHLALLRLETLRSSLNQSTVSARASGSIDTLERPESLPVQSEALDDAVRIISDAHRGLAAMMRATAPSAPHRLERDGMLHAIHTMLRQDFQQAFDEVEWEISEETMCHIDEMIPPALAELVFAAVQEAFRNAARHGRGSDLHRQLRLSVKASYTPHLEILVSDDGVGIGAASSTTTGTGGGLLTHSALLAIAGGSLTVKSSPEGGVTVRIFLPAEALR